MPPTEESSALAAARRHFDAWNRRDPAAEALLTTHTDFLRQRAAAVRYSARILFQELRHHRDYHGSYETVKRFVAPLRELQAHAELTQPRFETITEQPRLEL